MAIYVFNLLVGYYLGGVDYAQGTRAPYLRNISKTVKYIFTDVPREREISEYQKLGIAAEDMLSAHFLMSGNETIGADAMVCKTFSGKQGMAVREYYTDRLVYTDYYSYVDWGNGPENRLVRRAFRRPDGTSAYDIMYDEGRVERYLFPNGEILSKQEFLCRFIQKLNLTKNDIILIDRPGKMDYVQPLFTHANEAKIVVFLHSGHYAKKGQSDFYLYLNYEHYYWFSNTEKIDTIIVSTEWQKKSVIEKLTEYGQTIPKIEVIPAGGLEKLRYPDKPRDLGSLLTVSRLVKGKKIEWIIRSVIEAHRMNPTLHLDIYGDGAQQYKDELKKIVEENNAESFIRFMGHCDVTNVYKKYEAYISASLWETLGLSLMEATGSGNAMIGLNVEYGNKVFIQDGVNGYTTELDFERINEEAYEAEVIRELAQNIVKIYEVPERLQLFQEKSYQIAEAFLNDSVGALWKAFLSN